MVNFLNDKATSLIIDFIKVNYEQITVQPGKCKYNYMCHANAVHRAARKKHANIVLCFTVSDCGDGPCIHFINYNKGVYTDNTLGVWAENYQYYFVRFIPDIEFKEVFTIHKKLRQQIRRQLPYFVRLFSDVEV